MVKAFPYTTSEPHVHEFSGEDEQRRVICIYCGVPVTTGDYSGEVKSYIDYSIPGALYEKRTKWNG